MATEATPRSLLQEGLASSADSHPVNPLGPDNTEISSEDRAILAVAGFVCFISLLDGPLLPWVNWRIRWLVRNVSFAAIEARRQEPGSDHSSHRDHLDYAHPSPRVTKEAKHV